MAAYRRLVIASNRLPFTAEYGRGRVTLRPTTGGLASALSAVHQQGQNIWIGWPGDCSALDAAGTAEMSEMFGRQRVVAVPLSGREVIDYYDGVCNAGLWPVLHYQLDRLPLTLPPFEAYRAVNERFAETIVERYQPGDLIWIHDYHLMLAPAMVRRRLPDAQIGFFLHTPFPAADVFRVLPWRLELLEGLLGSTVIGFQTSADAANFASTVGSLTCCAIDSGGAVANGRRIDFGAYPIGIDAGRLRDSGRASRRFARADCRLFVGVDRLDYTKGIPLRLAAFERLLAENPALHGKVQLLQVAVPSREHVPSYANLKREVEGLIARVNVRFGTPAWTPVRHVPESLPPADLAALYRAADVMLVTALRDGMNLVAKEFVCAREDDDGVLILSELAGAASELTEAILVNPYSVEALVGAMLQALDMDREERRQRMSALRTRLDGRTVHGWADRFTSAVAAAATGCMHRPAAAARTMRSAIDRGVRVSLAVPFEGTLVADPRDAARFGPDPELLGLLRDLAARSGITLHVISGLDPEKLDAWFDLTPAVIWAEHGLWRREPDGRRWRRTQWTTADWADDVRQLMKQFVASTPGSFMAEGANAIAWHFDRAESVLGRSQAQMLAALLGDAAGALGYEVSTQPHLVEVRASGLSIPRTVQKVIEMNQTSQVVFIGDAAAAAGVEDILRPADILIDFTGETSPGDARRTRSLLRELADSLAPARPSPLPLPAGLRTASGYATAGLSEALGTVTGIRIER